MRWLDASPRRAAPKGHETFILRAASFSHRLLPRATPFRAHGAKCHPLKEAESACRPVVLAGSWGVRDWRGRGVRVRAAAGGRPGGASRMVDGPGDLWRKSQG